MSLYGNWNTLGGIGEREFSFIKKARRDKLYEYGILTTTSGYFFFPPFWGVI